MKLLGIISVASVVTDQLRIRFSAFGRFQRKIGVQWDGAAVIYSLHESL
jgi:hypothetical protein